MSTVETGELTPEQVAEHNAKHRPERMLRLAGLAFHFFQAILTADQEILLQCVKDTANTFDEIYGDASGGSLMYIKDDLLAFAEENRIGVEAHLVPVASLKKANMA